MERAACNGPPPAASDKRRADGADEPVGPIARWAARAAARLSARAPRLAGLLNSAGMRYAIASGLSVSITVGLPIPLVELAGASPRTASAIGFALAFCVNFVSLKYFVYRAGGGWSGQVLRYVATSIAFRLTEFAAFVLLNEGLGLHYLPALALVVGTSFAAKFAIFRLFVFHR